MVVSMYNTQLNHHGVKGMKWGVRRNTNKSSNIEKVGKKVGKTVGNQLKKAADKANNKRNTWEKVGKVAGNAGVAVSVVGNYYGYKSKKRIKSTIAHVANAAANAYIVSGQGSYAKKRGVDYVRRAAITGLSVSSIVDGVKAIDNVGATVRGAKERNRKR